MFFLAMPPTSGDAGHHRPKSEGADSMRLSGNARKKRCNLMAGVARIR
ncbi:MAG: hypothetical protein JWM54_1357 [Acidobacteriaceae bacterium]|jgi:hypothetical protein|nr:hypothetical protein [Acidobacteriaceae bacterium]